MSYGQVAPLETSAARALAGTFMQNSLTQELVVLVILVVIALALIFVCGWMGRRRTDAVPATGAKERAGDPGRAQARTAVPTEAVAERRAVMTEESEQPEQVAIEPIGAAAEAEEMVTAVEMADEVAAAEVSAPVAARTVEIVETAEPWPAAPPKPDDLKIVEGIGPKVSQLLNDAGIFTFVQLAETRVERLQEIVDAAKLRMMDPASWPEQARLAANGDWDGLKKLQDDLKGGRHV